MLVLKHIFKDYAIKDNKPVVALRDISLKFPETGFVCILGPSGCGKTTLLNIIGGLDKYTDGDVIINGQSTKNYTDQDWDAYRNREIGIVFQNYNLIPHLTVKGNVELAMTLSGISPKERDQRAQEVLISVGLKSEIDKKPNQMSGGQMQRVAIARAIVNQPNIVLADEPTGALDSVTSVQVMELLKTISKTKLVIMVTHNQALADKYASRIITLTDGKVLSDTEKTTQPIVETKQSEANKDNNQKAEETKPKHTAMSFLTALGISGHNLNTKKGKTIVTSIAASFGIIGVGLVLALSNGFTGYVNRMESETFSKFPVSVEKYGYDYVNNSTSDLTAYPDDEEIHVVEPTTSSLHVNNITSDYINYLSQMNDTLKKKNNSKTDYAKVRYNYSIGMHVLSKYTSNGTDVYTSLNTSQESYLESLTSMMSTSSSAWQELPADSTMIQDTYDVLKGSYPDEETITTDEYGNPDQDEFGLVLVVNSKNALTTTLMSSLGMDPSTGTISFDDILGREFEYVLSDDYYGEAKLNVDKDNNAVYTPGIYFKNSVTMTDIMNALTANEDSSSTSISLTSLSDLFDIPDNSVLKIALTNVSVIAALAALTPYINMTTLQTKLQNTELSSLKVPDIKECLVEDKLNSGTDEEKETNRTAFGKALDNFIVAIRDCDQLKPYFNKQLTYYSSPANNQTELAKLYTNTHNRKLKIKAILRQKNTTSLGLLSTGIYYPKTLTYQSFYDNQNCSIGQDFKNHLYISPTSTENYATLFKDSVDNIYASDTTDETSLSTVFSPVTSSFSMAALNIVDSLNKISTNSLSTYMNVRLSLGTDVSLSYTDSTSVLDPLTYSSFVSTITIYPTDYASKKAVTDYLSAYNTGKTTEAQVIYTDVGQTATDIVGQIVSVISAVLIAFASISLVVSSVMIGIIIYSSVVERTKEIGILRSIGARKKDVGRLFKAEAVIIGFISGMIGIVITYLISIPLSLILDNMFPEVELGMIAFLNPLHAVLLLLLSIILTYIASLIPARIAAKKDPVTCLRTE